MRATILGCGEAFDERLPNTSILVETGSATVLCDCGYSVPRQLWSHVPDPDRIDIIYISHPHADHYFGMPPVLGRMWEDGRTKPLTIISQQSVLDQLKDLDEYGYRGLSARYKYEIHWTPASPRVPVHAAGIEFEFAETTHSVTNLAVRMRSRSATFCYSGDGMFTKASRALFREADLVVHEAYQLDPSPVHADIPGLLAMASEEGIRSMALVHVQRNLRKDLRRIEEAMTVPAGILLSFPEPMEKYEVGS